MKMNDYINDFTNHLTDALLIGDSSNLKKTSKSFSNILICGLGGSGIGGTIVKDLISRDVSVPIETSKGYDIPGFVNEETQMNLTAGSFTLLIQDAASCQMDTLMEIVEANSQE